MSDVVISNEVGSTVTLFPSDAIETISVGGVGPPGAQGPPGAASTVPGPAGTNGAPGAVEVFEQAAEPTASVGALWIDTDAVAPVGGIPDAPSDGVQYARQDAGWTEVVAGGGGGGTASSVTFTPVGTVAATDVQAAIAEVASEKVAKLGDTMAGPLVFPVGSTAATQINFGGANTGFYGIGTTNLAMAISGVNRFTLSGSTLTATVPFRAALGSVTAPAYSFTASTNTGVYCVAGSLNVSVAGVETMRWVAADNSTLALGPLMASGAPTADLQVATKLYVDTAINLKANTVSPTFTGVPIAPTATTGTSNTQIATTAFVGASMSAAGALGEAPNDGQYYSRRNLAWSVSPGGLADAPNDANAYGRKAAAWATVLPIAGGTMTGVLSLANGTAAAPSLCFSAGTAYGLYWFGSAIGFSCGGANRMTVGAVNLSTTLTSLFPNGSATAPAYAFTNNPNTGLYRPAANNVSISANGVEAMRWTGADNSTLALGPLMVSAAPTVDLQVATKKYVDDKVSPGPSTSDPLIDGIAAPGTSLLYSRGDHVHPTDTSRLEATHAGTGGEAHANVIASGAAGFMAGSDKTKLDGIQSGANNYAHPVGDGNLHVPATGTVSNGKFLKAGSTAGSGAWQTLTAADISGVEGALAAKAPLASPVFTGAVVSQGDITLYRPGASNTSAIFFDSLGTKYIYNDGSTFFLNQHINVSGRVTLSGDAGGLQSSTTNMLIGASIGNIFFRPHGVTSGTNQVTIDNLGGIILSGSGASFRPPGGGVNGGFTCKTGNTNTIIGNYFNIFYESSNAGMYLYTDNTVMGMIAYQSDYRIKKDVTPLPSMWNTVKALKPISYTLQPFTPPSELERSKETQKPFMSGGDEPRWGFIAHEVQETTVATASSAAKDAPDAIQDLNWMPVVAALTKALQEAMTRIEALEAAS